MGVYTQFVDAYKRESSYGTSTITAAGDATSLFGLIGREQAVWPTPSFNLHYGAPPLCDQETAQADIEKGRADLMGMLPVGIQNGILLEAVMGKSATTGSDPYTHTITKPTAVAGILPLLPSFTLQHERKGTATDWAIQYVGAKVAGLRLVTSWEHPQLIARVDWLAQEASDPGFVLDSGPTLPTTANTAPYHFSNLTRTFNAVNVEGLVALELAILPGLKAEHVHRWDGATYKGHYPDNISEAVRKDYELRLNYMPGSDDIWDELVKVTDNTYNVVLKWTRSTNDYIEATLTDCWVIDHDTLTPTRAHSLLETVVMKPRSVSFSVKDSIAGDSYGE